MQGLLIKTEFFTAHFRRHETKKFRSTMLLPPPTAVWGIIGAIFGIPAISLESFIRENDAHAGAELIDYKGVLREKATLWKWEQGWEKTVEEMEFLVEPTYMLAVAGKSSFIEDLENHIENYMFKADPSGGISDCMLKDIKIEGKREVKEELKVKGMVPEDLVERSEIIQNSKALRIRVLYGNTSFYQGFNVEFKLKKAVKSLDGIAIWGFHDVEAFRKGFVQAIP